MTNNAVSNNVMVKIINFREVYCRNRPICSMYCFVFKAFDFFFLFYRILSGISGRPLNIRIFRSFRDAGMSVFTRINGQLTQSIQSALLTI